MASSGTSLPQLKAGLPALAKLNVLPKTQPKARDSKVIKKKEPETSEEEEEDEEEKEEEEEEKDDEGTDSDENTNIRKIESRELDQNASFFATFMDGSTLRYLIEYLRLTTTEGTFIFSKDYITYQKGDEDHTIFNDVRLKTYELTDFEFSSVNTEVPVTLNLAELRNKTRTVGKKEQMDIYRRAEEPGNFYIQVRAQEKTGSEPTLYCMQMKTENINIDIYKLPEYARGKKNPNCTVHQTDFTRICKSLVASKCSYAEFIGYDKGIVIKGMSSDNKIVLVKQYGKCRQNTATKTSTTESIMPSSDKNRKAPAVKLNVRDSDELEHFKIDISTIKTLAKVNGFCNNGTIKFYIERELPMKLCVPIGGFGKMSILVRNSA